MTIVSVCYVAVEEGKQQYRITKVRSNPLSSKYISAMIVGICNAPTYIFVTLNTVPLNEWRIGETTYPLRPYSSAL